MNPKLWARMAHVVDGKAADQRPAYYDLIKFAIQKKAEINFDEAKKTRDLTSKPKATTHFHFNPKKSGLPATPAVWMVALVPEERSGKGEATPLPSEESDSGESYEAGQLSLRAMWRLLSEWSKHLRHLQVDASDAIRWDIDSMMRNVKCLTLNF